jgi:membrane-associated phospholipid phosphatase
MILLIGLIGQPGQGAVSRALREVYPLVLLPLPLYGALDLLNRFETAPVHDALIQRWEAALFGGQISREWWQANPSPFLSTLFHGAYFSFYLILAAPVAYFALRKDRTALRRTVMWIVSTFVVCYLVFLFFPVAGPYYVFPRPTGTFVDNPMARLVYGVLALGSSYGAAFPSSHVAATVAALAAAWCGSRTLALVLVPPAILLTVGVVYCQMHYGVDALAGLATGVVVVGAEWMAFERTPAGRRTEGEDATIRTMSKQPSEA